MILVTGANGMVGSYVKEVFAGEELLLTDIDTMDITNYELVEKVVRENEPKVILHLAAETDVDNCEKEINRAYKTNALGTTNISLICRKYDILLVYISTGGVFDGNKPEPYTEYDIPNPPNNYAKSKLEGEKVIQNFLTKYFIVRAGWMIGGGEKDKKFVSKIVALCKERPEIKVVNDKYGTITYAKHLLKNIRELIKTEYYGIYHMVNSGVCTRYDIALEIAKYLKKSVKIIPVSSAHFPLPASRGRSEALVNYKLELLGSNKMPGWKEALQEYLDDWLGEKAHK